MHRLVLYVVCLFVLVVSPAMRALALDALAEADGIRLFEKGKVLGGRAKDLLEIGKQKKEPINPSEISDLDAFRQAYADLHEQTIAMTLAGEAAANADHLLSVGTLLRCSAMLKAWAMRLVWPTVAWPRHASQEWLRLRPVFVTICWRASRSLNRLSCDKHSPET